MPKNVSLTESIPCALDTNRNKLELKIYNLLSELALGDQCL